jgi:hypothetical protein
MVNAEQPRLDQRARQMASQTMAQVRDAMKLP